MIYFLCSNVEPDNDTQDLVLRVRKLVLYDTRITLLRAAPFFLHTDDSSADSLPIGRGLSSAMVLIAILAYYEKSS